MKIGILTYHRSHNYGALLQAIALREYFIDLGHETYFIDYWPKYHESMYSVIDYVLLFNSSIKSSLKYLAKTLPTLHKRYNRIKTFNQFISKYITPYSIPYKKDYEYDIAIYGSDQIWRKQYGLGNKFNSIYFAENTLKVKRHISYSASMGNIQWDNNDIEFLKSHLSKFDNLAVREQDLLESLTKIGIKGITKTIDPTFLVDVQKWEQIFKLKDIVGKPYILYFNLMQNCFDLKKIKEYAKSKGLKLIILESDARHVLNHGNIFETVGPEYFLSLIKYADTVLTSSFHGLAFSIIFGKQFYVSLRSNSDRAKTLLNMLSIDERFIECNSAIPVHDEKINYDNVFKKLTKLKCNSKDYLNNALRLN